MALDNIDHLLEKYDNAETTLAEEAQLKAYFAEENVPPHLESYKLLFNYVAAGQQEQFTKNVILQPKRRKLYQWVAVAAVAVLMVGGYMQVSKMNQKTTIDDLSREQLMAYNQTLEVFNLVSEKLNRGTSNLEVLDLVSDKLNEGAENLNHLKEFNKTVDKLTTNK